jgi:hypothetical protein
MNWQMVMRHMRTSCTCKGACVSERARKGKERGERKLVNVRDAFVLYILYRKLGGF